MTTIETLLTQLKAAPELIQFDEVIAVINAHFIYSPTDFTNGVVINASGSNEGSCKIFAFSRIYELTQAETLALFGAFYRDDVLGEPDGDNHANIRSFMQTGWNGIEFSETALALKHSE